MSLEVIFGPPGTGKTTELSRLTRQYIEEEGSDSVLLCAYTKTAARELAGRDLPLDSHQVGTLHSHCYHALDRPNIAESFYEEWNDAYPVYPLSKQKSLFDHDDPPGVFKLFGDECLNTVNVLRHRMVDPDRWPAPAQAFWSLWSRWKYEHGYCDFTDLIDKARVLVPVPPGRPNTLIVDEAQDLSVLQWDLLTRWSTHVSRFIGAGDDDQALYRWTGADFRPLLAAPDRRVLPQSYRVPARLQTWAYRYTANIQQRQPKTWLPRNVDGVLQHEAGSWAAAEGLVPRLKEWLDEPWGTVACIAPCAYMLEPMVDALEQYGVPFGNRWRLKNHTWNPLAPPSHGVGALQRLLDFLRPPARLWTWQELSTWLPLVRSDGILQRGAKSKVTLHAKETHVCTLADLEGLFKSDSLQGALTGELAWLENHVLQSRAKSLAYPVRVYRHYGREGLTEEPRITIGTAHSLKGAESDRVIFWNDLSGGQRRALCEGGADADDVYRMLYVACTRAREEMYVIGGSYV